MIFAFLLLLQLTRYNVEGKHFLVETKDGGDQVCKINVQCYAMIDFHQVGVDYGRFPGNVDIPLLQYLLKCGHLKRKPGVNSNYDIYTNEEVLKCVFVSVFVFVCM